MTQSSTCPESLSIDRIDQRLKEYIDSQQKHFRQKIHHQLSKFKENIDTKQLDHILFNENLTHDQVGWYPLMILFIFFNFSLQKEMIHRAMTIQDNQLAYWKEFLMFEQRILSKFLPENFDQLQNFITSNFYSPIVNDDSVVKYQLKHIKFLQESKRIWLDIYLRAYILKIRQYDQQYQYELVQLKQRFNNSTETPSRFQSIETCMTQRRNRLKQEIYLQMKYFHVKLTRRRQYSSKTKQMIGVSPEVILDVHHRYHDLNAVEREYLSRSKNYITAVDRRIIHFHIKLIIFDHF